MSTPNYAGLLSWTRARSTGTQVGIYDAEAAGMDPESGRYSVVCEDHGTTVNVGSYRLARQVAAYPAENWCEVCRAALESAR